MSSFEPPDAFELRPLLYPALPLEPGVNPSSPAALARSLRCAEPYGNHLYLGSTDGQVFCFVQPQLDRHVDAQHSTSGPEAGAPETSWRGSSSASRAQRPAQEQEFRLSGVRSISSKPIERIIIIPSVHVAAVLSESTLSFHELPSFLPIPPQVLPHIKGVATVALDDQELHGSTTDQEGLIGLCVIRRKNIVLAKMSKDTWRVIQEIPLPGGATNARRYGDWLCISTTADYNVVNLKDATMSSVGLPISQTSEAPSASSRPSIISVARDEGRRCEFLITSHSDDLTLGVFISQEGEPTAKLLEWPSHPRGLALDFPYLHALLRNDTIEIHHLDSMTKEQTLHLPSALEPRVLSSATSSLNLVDASDRTGMAIFEAQLSPDGNWTPVPEQQRRIKKDSKTTAGERHAQANVLMVGKNVVQGICPARLLDSALRATQRGDSRRAEALADRIRQHRPTNDMETAERSEMIYLDQMVGVNNIRTLRFEQGINQLIRSGIDHRVLLRFFPSLSENLIDPDQQVELFAEVATTINDLGSLEAFPEANLSQNYCPPLDLKTNATLQRLKTGMEERIHTLSADLCDTLRQDKLLMSDEASARQLDTFQARLFIRDKDSERLSSFLESGARCDMSLIEPHLAETGCHAVLAQRLRSRGKIAEALEIYTKLADKELIDESHIGGTHIIADILQNCDDAELVHQYSIWLVQRDSEAGIKLLTKGRAGPARNDRETLQQLRRVDDKAAKAFLEAIALGRRNQDVEAQKDLAAGLLQDILKALQDRKERDAMQAIVDDYTQGAYAESFVAHLAFRADQSPVVIPRLQLMALIQGSTHLDEASLQKQFSAEPLFRYEQAILLGKKEEDFAALELLAIQLRDANSAETYCNQNRQPLSLLALQGTDIAELKVYLSFLSRALKRNVGLATKSGNLGLLKTLLRVYMEKGRGSEFQIATTHLLNTQAMHLSGQEILATVPSHWTVRTVETFLARSLRREMHRLNEGQISRAMALSQNLEVAETLWAKRRGLGGVIEDGEGDSGARGDVGGVGEVQDDSEDVIGRALVEKVQAQEKMKEEKAYPDSVGVENQKEEFID